MSVSYLHGVEVFETVIGSAPIQVVRSSVIGLIGIAPKGPTNTLSVVASKSDIATWGSEVPGFTIPQSLNAIFANQPTSVLIVNVFDPATHTTAVAAEAVVIAAGKAKLAFCPIGALTNFFEADGITPTGAVVGTDYTIDDFGNIVVLDNTTLPDATYHIGYVKLNAAAITDSVIIGGTTGGVRTGLDCFDTAYNAFGFKVKQLIAPNYSTTANVSAAMILKANSYKAMAWFDCAAGTSVSVAIAGRGSAATIHNFNVSNKRVGLLYNMPQAYDAYTNAAQTRWYSAYFAGLVAWVDANLGYWFSPSNKQINGLVGMEKILTWDIADETGTTEANQLNAAGIITMVSGFATGNLSWGNSSSYFPGNTTPDQFICVQRTRDVVEESIAYAMLPFIDAPILLPQIDSVTETVNTFMRSLIQRGGLIDGSVCLFDPSLNSDTELAAGHIVFTLTLMSPTPGQRITFNSALDISLLKNLIKTS